MPNNIITTTDLKKQENGLQNYIQGIKSKIYCGYCQPERNAPPFSIKEDEPAWKQWIDHCHLWHPDKWGDIVKDKKTGITVQAGMLGNTNQMHNEWNKQSNDSKIKALHKLFGSQTIMTFEDFPRVLTLDTIKWKPSTDPKKASLQQSIDQSMWIYLVYLCVLAQHDVGIRHVIDQENDRVFWIDAWSSHALENSVNGSDMHNRAVNMCSYIFGMKSDEVVRHLNGRHDNSRNRPNIYPYALVPSNGTNETAETSAIKRKWQHDVKGPSNGCLTPAAVQLYKEFRKFFKHERSNEFQGISNHLKIYEKNKQLHESYTKRGQGHDFNLSKFFEVTVAKQGWVDVEQTEVVEQMVKEPPMVTTLENVFMPEEPAYLVEARENLYDTWLSEAPDQHSVPTNIVRQPEPKIEASTRENTAQEALEILLEKAKRVDYLEKENEQLNVELAGVYANIANIGADRDTKTLTIQEQQNRMNELYEQINAYESKRGSTKEFFMANLERFKKSQNQK